MTSPQRACKSAVAEKRPDIEISFSHFHKSLILLAVAEFLTSLAIIAWYWPTLPQRIPRHFGLYGNADTWGRKGSLLLLPIISIPMLFAFIGLSFIPQSYNYPFRITPENAARQYSLARTLVLTICAELC